MAGAAWCELLEAHAIRVYKSAKEASIDGALLLAERIKESLPNPFRPATDIVRKGWTGLTSAAEAWQAVAVLESHGWVKTVEIPPGRAGGRVERLVYISTFLPAGKEVKA
jgi:hypothetical protein